jgi:hypothetical protein
VGEACCCLPGAALLVGSKKYKSETPGLVVIDLYELDARGRKTGKFQKSSAALACALPARARGSSAMDGCGAILSLQGAGGDLRYAA